LPSYFFLFYRLFSSIIEHVFGMEPQGYLEEQIVELQARMRALDAEWLALIAEYDRSHDWQASGYASAANGVRHLCRMNTGHAAADVALARKTAELAKTAAALAAGEISRPHVQVIANAYTPQRSGALAGLESEFVETARKFEPWELRNVVRYVTDAIDGDGGSTSDEEQFGRRHWYMSRTIDRMLKIDGLVSGDDAEIWEKVIGAEMDRDRVAEDARSLAQMRADAATNVMRHALDTGTVGNTRKVRPHVTVVIDLDDVPGSTPELVELVRTQRRYQGSLSRSTLDRILCDCDVTRVLMAGESEVLDVGRATRTVSRAQWAALVARDRHCVTTGCDAPPERCEAHHRHRWGEGGNTDVDNLELRCRRCHRQQHRQPNPLPTERAA
jgi:Domain of unknown function (DUF222)/HNH endonuclease